MMDFPVLATLYHCQGKTKDGRQRETKVAALLLPSLAVSLEKPGYESWEDFVTWARVPLCPAREDCSFFAAQVCKDMFAKYFLCSIDHDLSKDQMNKKENLAFPEFNFMELSHGSLSDLVFTGFYYMKALPLGKGLNRI